MEQNHPCLLFSKSFVAARAKVIIKREESNSDEEMIKATGKRMEAAKIKRLIRLIIHESNK